MNKSLPVTEDSINQLISSEINNSKIESLLLSVIQEQTFLPKNLVLNRNNVVEKILNSKHVKELENEIVENILKNNIFPNKDRSSMENQININLKTFKNKNINTYKNDFNVNNDLESYKLINLLLEEIIQCEDHLTLENYLGDLANFEADLIVGNDKINELLRKIDSFLLKCISKDEFLTNNIINILTKMTSSSNIQTKILIELILIYSNFMLKSCEKFYKIKFDISRYYNMSVNFECLNNMISKLHNENISLKKVEYTKVKQIVDNYFSLLIYNYDEKQQINNIPFGISTNYMLILLFCLDNDLVNLKILFRNCHTRTLIISILHKIKFLIFVDYKRSLSLFSEKSSFLWKHTSVLEQIYPSYKISKKFFYYAWYHIQINFVGLIVRYKKCREIFYNLYENIDIKLCCWRHFDNILEFFFITQSKGETNVLKEFEEYQKENLFYLIKEVCCDFILYCNNRECLEIKKSKVLSYYHNTENNKYFKYFFEDLIEAFKENVYCDKNWDIGKKISI